MLEIEWTVSVNVAGGSVVLFHWTRSFMLLYLETIPAKMASSSKTNNNPEISATNTLSYIESSIFSVL